MPINVAEKAVSKEEDSPINNVPMQEPRPGVIGYKTDGCVTTVEPGIECVPANRVFEIVRIAFCTAYH